MADIAFAYLMRIAEEDKRARAAAPNYMEIAEVKKALGKAMGDDSISALQAVVEKYPWIALPVEELRPQLSVAPGKSTEQLVEDIKRAMDAKDALARKAVEPVAPVAPAQSMVAKKTGRMAVDSETGEMREVKTVINPQGDIEAAKLTKETGVMHIVNPITGAIESTGFTVAAPLPDGGNIEVDPHAPVNDVRPPAIEGGKMGKHVDPKHG